MQSNDSFFASLKSNNATTKRKYESFSSTSHTNDTFKYKAEKYGDEITHFVMRDYYVEGEVSKSQLFLEKLYFEKGEIIFREAFQHAWLSLYTLDNPGHLYTFACIASGLPYEWLENHGTTLMLGCSSHKSELVNEACIRMVEAWEEPKHVNFLENMTPFEIDWLEDYRLSTINFLKGL
ncbi:hypothetical protein [Shewanella algae]|uniref:hypothetical protein n=1 Tax=Shewanella algae TaxID=38313 RepID=UPI00313A9008